MIASFKFSKLFVQKTVLASSVKLPSTTMAQNYSTNFEPKFYSKSGERLTEDGFFGIVADFVRNVSSTRHKGVLFLGENHQDPSAHKLELKILEKVFEMSKNENLKFGFSLEFYDRANQPILDEFLSGFFDYETFLNEIGPGAPGNDSDYRPLLEFCRNFKIPIIASNCPRRYSKLVAKNGRQILEKLPQKSRNNFAPLPYQNPSEEYCQNFLRVMTGDENPDFGMSEKMSKMLDAQSLWDATMAFSICESFEHLDFVAHVSGYFHVKKNLGIFEHLNPNILSHTVVMLPEERPDFDNDQHSELADSVILTDLNNIV